MKLVKIFSNKNFKNVKFDSHFNVVLAEIHDKKSKKDTHNLGKTSLIHVIDFLLLGGKEKLTNKIFWGQIFYLEIELNSGKYLVIKRSIDSATKISFKINDVQLADFTPPRTWDEEDIPFEKAKEKLNEYLAFNVVLGNWDYRKSITYFLRTQQDYLDVYQLGKFKGKHIDWKPFVFELLGYNGDLIKKKLELEEESKQEKNKINVLEQEANVNVGDRDKIAGLIDVKESEKIDAEQSIDKFNFFLQDNALTKEIIEDLDLKIQTLNTDRYRIKYELTKTEDSLRNLTGNINVAKLKELFEDVQLYFPQQLSKQYDELEQFNKSISEERRKYLSENLQSLKSEFSTIDNDIHQLEKSKSEKLSFLTEKDTFTKFKTYQKQLSVLEADIDRLKEKLQLIDKSVTIEDSISNINEKINASIYEITEVIKQRKHAEINKIFNDILTEIVGTNAIISIKQNKSNNVEFSAVYTDPDTNALTSEAEGTSYKKLLCMAFDLSLLIFYSKKSFFRFAYHDGVLEGLDNRIKIRLLDKVKSICNEYNLQHIISLIDSDIPQQNDGTPYLFTQEEICLQLNDLDDNGKLFRQSF
jgi:uncharacterized protein YydD (DUF2326 family)